MIMFFYFFSRYPNDVYFYPILYGPVDFIYDEFSHAWFPVYVYYTIDVFYFYPVQVINVHDEELNETEVNFPSNEKSVEEFCQAYEFETNVNK